MRIAALAHAGQTLLSAAAASGIDHGEIRTVSHGHWRLKGVAEPVELFEALPPGGNPRAPCDGEKAHRVLRQGGAWIAAAQAGRRLPAERASFVSDATTLTHVVELFDAGARVVTLTGPGGIGKTRAALRFVHHAAAGFAAGAWFCDLAGAHDEATVLHAVGAAIDVPLSTRGAAARLAAAIRGRGRGLIVLDNAERCASALASQLARWLAAAPDACFLVTSRVRLDLPEERVAPIPPLARDAAVALFVERASAAGVDLAEAERAELPALVELLDGLPLAIEMAAARSRLLPPSAMRSRIHDRLLFLARARPAPNDRQASLRAVLDSSWELLTDAEQCTLSQVSVFEGGFTLEAAERVVEPGASGAAPWVGDCLQALLDHSLLVDRGAGRLGMLQTVHDHAVERLVASGEAAPTRRRHWRHFARLPEAAVEQPGFADLDNVVAACDRAADAGDGPAAAAALVLAGEALLRRGPVERLLTLARRVDSLPGMPAAARADVLRVLGNALYPLGQPQEAAAAYERGLALARQAGDADRCARLGCALALLLTHGGDLAAAARLLDEAHAKARTAADPLRLCAVLNAQGSLALAQQRPDDAERRFEQALPLARRAASRRWEGGLLGNLGAALYAQGRREPARTRFQASLAAARDVGDRQWAANASCNLGLLQLETGETEQAQASLHDALATAREIGLTPLEATASCNLGLLKLKTGDPHAALADLDHAARLARQLADDALAAQCERARSRALSARGLHAEAIRAAEQARALAQHAGDQAEAIRACLQAADAADGAEDERAASAWLAEAQRLGAAAPEGVAPLVADELAAAARRISSRR